MINVSTSRTLFVCVVFLNSLIGDFGITDLYAEDSRIFASPKYAAFDLTQVAVRPDISTSLNPMLKNNLSGVGRNDTSLMHNSNFAPIGNGMYETDPEKIQLKITFRYQDQKMKDFVNSTTMSQVSKLFMEASNLIDLRHVAPLSYSQRSDAALSGLIRALSNSEFLKFSDARGSESNLQIAVSNINAMIGTTNINSAEDCLSVLHQAADSLKKDLGMRREVVAIEFLNANLDALDKFSAIIPSKASASIDPVDTILGQIAGLEERIVGVGIEMKKHDSGALIMGTIEGSSAAAAGLKKGDLLIDINNRNLSGMSINQIADLITGAENTIVRIVIEREGKKYSANLIRKSIYVGSVSNSQMIDDSTGYVRVKQFSESSTEDLEKALLDLYRRHQMRTVILDFRGNPGGLLTEAVQLSDLFLPSGIIVSTKGRTLSDNSTELAQRAKTWSLPLVVLIDENSASASEIFAAAIQDNDRGVIVGRRSYGKGTVQTHFPLNTTSAILKLTTAKFFAPSGREMAGFGVNPDYLVANANDASANSLSEDNDLLKALEVIQSGLPERQAQSAGQTR